MTLVNPTASSSSAYKKKRHYKNMITNKGNQKYRKSFLQLVHQNVWKCKKFTKQLTDGRHKMIRKVLSKLNIAQVSWNFFYTLTSSADCFSCSFIFISSSVLMRVTWIYLCFFSSVLAPRWTPDWNLNKEHPINNAKFQLTDLWFFFSIFLIMYIKYSCFNI